MIYDYRDQDGYVSLWIGTCDNGSTLETYLATEYLDEEEATYHILCERFLPANQGRTCEEELRAAFHDEYYNQFEYDFGLTFDEDLCDAHVIECDTRDLELLFQDFSYCDTFIADAKSLPFIVPPQCNAAVALYDFKYCGDIFESTHEQIHLHFMGYVKYSKT